MSARRCLHSCWTFCRGKPSAVSWHATTAITACVHSCLDVFRALTFAQLTYRESLRDIEVCLSAQAAKLYHMDLMQAPGRSTLSDALAQRDWHIYFEFAQCLIVRARTLYATGPLTMDLHQTVYVLVAIVKNELQPDARSTLCYRFCRSLFSRKLRYNRPWRAVNPRPISPSPATN